VFTPNKGAATTMERNVIMVVMEGGKQVSALVDSGSDISLISTHLLPRKKVRFATSAHDIAPLTANGSVLKINSICNLRVSINDAIAYSFVFHASDMVAHEVILGRDFLEAFSAIIDFRRHTLSLGTADTQSQQDHAQQNTTPRHFRVRDTTWIEPHTARWIPLKDDTPHSNVHDAYYIQPLPDLWKKKKLVAANCLGTATKDQLELLVENHTRERKLLPQSMKIATGAAIRNTEVNTLTSHIAAPAHPDGAENRVHIGEIEQNINLALPGRQRKQIRDITLCNKKKVTFLPPENSCIF